MKKNKVYIILAAICIPLIVTIVVCACKWTGYANILLTQKAADRWRGGSADRFAQVSVFFPGAGMSSYEEVLSFRSTVDQKLVAAGLEKPEVGSLWQDAYSGTSIVEVKGDRGASTATVVGVGGDFFLFHPYEMLSGSFISPNDLMGDRVVLDYELAWKLFGASDLEGMSVTIDNKPYYVAGVIRRESDGFTKMAYTDENPMMFIDYRTMTELNETAGITCYEIAMADPINGYAKSVAEEYFKNRAAVVENSARYDFGHIFSYFSDYGRSHIESIGAIYPYWENAARVSEVYIARLLLIIILMSLFPLVCIVWLLVELIKTLVGMIKRGKHEVYEAWDDRYARLAAREERKQAKRLAKLEKSDEPREEASASEDGEDGGETGSKKRKRRKKRGGKHAAGRGGRQERQTEETAAK